MRRLMLLRHAKTETDAPSGRDRDRRLDDRGHTDAADLGRWIGRHPPLPDLVLVSPATRAQQTWEIAGSAMRDAASTGKTSKGAASKDPASPPKVEFLPDLYGAEPAELLHAIHMAAANDPHRLMIVGHNPGLHELALALAGSGDASGRRALEDNLPTSGLALLDFAINDWTDVAFRRGNLVGFVSPKVLRETSDD
jgi:phosphohistidine phosphatase